MQGGREHVDHDLVIPAGLGGIDGLVVRRPVERCDECCVHADLHASGY
jgi:hypothetical protein